MDRFDWWNLWTMRQVCYGEHKALETNANCLYFFSLFGAMFPLPRIIYAMASDALVFKFLGSVNERFKTPVVGTLLAALLTGKHAQ